MEKTVIRISVRNLVEFILRSGDLDSKRGVQDKEAMQKGSRLHRKIQKQMGSNYRAEVSLKYDMEYEDLILRVEGRADGIFTENEKICIVSQTTFNYNKFQELVEIIRKKGYDILVLNTICNATEERQSEAATIAHAVDAMIVIGGKHSSNTQKLFEICKKECEDTYYIQTKEDLDLSVLQSISNVGITAGASTPNNIIEEVQKNVRNEL